MVDYQQLFNLVVGLAGAAGGWWLNTVWRSVNELQHQDRELAAQLGAMKVVVAGDYVKRDDLEKLVTGLESRITRKLDQIDSKLDGKVDK